MPSQARHDKKCVITCKSKITSKTVEKIENKIKNLKNCSFNFLQNKRGKDGAPEEIRTPDRRYRKPVLYPAELRAHLLF